MGHHKTVFCGVGVIPMHLRIWKHFWGLLNFKCFFGMTDISDIFGK